jgi:hypothetical protein
VQVTYPRTANNEKELTVSRGEFLEVREYIITIANTEAESWCMGPNAGVDINLTLCPLQSRLQHIYHGNPYARVDFIPPRQGFWIWPQEKGKFNHCGCVS